MAEEPTFILVQPSAEPIEIDDPIDRIAFIAHNCYRVPPKEHPSNLEFLSRIVGQGHLAMVEHAVFHALLSAEALEDLRAFSSPFVRIDVYGDKVLCSYSARVCIEHAGDADEASRRAVSALVAALPDEVRQLIPSGYDPASPYPVEVISEERVKELSSPLRDRHSWVSYQLVTDRGVTHELVRHRVCSFAQESTRYCNYTSSRHGGAISIVEPLDYREPGRKEIYDEVFSRAGRSYAALLKAGARPQEARAVLPTALKATIVVSCYLDEWHHIFDLRLAKAAHPECRRVLLLVLEDMVRRGTVAADWYGGEI